MKRWRVFFSIGASTAVEVEADTRQGAIDRAYEEACPPTLCHHCSDRIELGDIVDAVDVEEVD